MMRATMDADLRHQLALAAKRLHDRGEAEVAGVRAALTWCSSSEIPAGAALGLELRLYGAVTDCDLEAWLEEIFGSHQRARLQVHRVRGAVLVQLLLDSSGRALASRVRDAA